MTPPNLLTAEQHAEFDREVVRWQRVLGLNDWRVERGRKPSRNMAEVSINYVARLATYRVGDFGAAAITSATISSTALHEVSHVLLAELKRAAEFGIEGDALDSAEHRVIHTLEKLLGAGSAP